MRAVLHDKEWQLIFGALGAYLTFGLAGDVCITDSVRSPDLYCRYRLADQASSLANVIASNLLPPPMTYNAYFFRHLSFRTDLLTPALLSLPACSPPAWL